MSIRRNTLYNLFGHIVSLIVLVVTAPLYLDLIGDDRYGVLNIIWLLLGYFGFFDLGIGRAVAHYIAKMDTSQTPSHKQILWTALLVSLPMSIVGAVVLYHVLGYILGTWIEMSEMLQSEGQAALLWVALSLVPVVLIGGISGSLTGLQRFLEINVLTVLDRTLLQVLPLTVAFMYSPALEQLTLAVFIARIVSLIAWTSASWWCIPLLPLSSWNFGFADRLWRYGGWVTVSGLVGPILSGAERIIIGALTGAAAVTYYAVPFSLVSPFALLAGSLSLALFPRFSSMTHDQGRLLERRSADAVMLVATPLIVAMTFIIQPFLALWISPSFAARADGVGQILLVGFWANSLAKLCYVRLQGNGFPKTVAAIHLSEVLPYLACLYFLVEQFGIIGAAMAWMIRSVIDAVLLGWKSGLLVDIRRDLFAPTMIVLSAALVSCRSYDSLPMLFTIGFFFLGVSTWWAWQNGLSDLVKAFIGLPIDRHHHL